jgi:hypothetical protein
MRMLMFAVPVGKRPVHRLPDVLADDRTKFEASGDHKFVEKAHRRGKVGWDVGNRLGPADPCDLPGDSVQVNLMNPTVSPKMRRQT